MGLFDDDEELIALIEESNKFEPQEINKANVQAIINRCLEKKAERGHGKKNYAKILQERLVGKDSALIIFDGQRTAENSRNFLTYWDN